SWRRNLSAASTPFDSSVCSTRPPTRTTSAITRNENTYVAASATSTTDGFVAAINTPASTGPAICVSCCTPLWIALTSATAFSSSPATSGMTSRDDEKYGAAKTPTAKVAEIGRASCRERGERAQGTG